MINGMVAKVLSMFLSDFFENPENLSINQLLTGTVTLHNLKVKSSIISYLMLPVNLAFGMVKELEINIPWLSLGTKPITVEVRGIVLVYYVTPTKEWSASDLNTNWQDFKDVERLKEKSISVFLDYFTLSSKWNYLIHKIFVTSILSFHNIEIVIINTFNPSPYVFGINCVAGYHVKCNSNWQPIEQTFSANTLNYTKDASNNGNINDKFNKLMENNILTYYMLIFESIKAYYRPFTDQDDISFTDKSINEVSKWIRDTDDQNEKFFNKESFQLRFRLCNGPISDEYLSTISSGIIRLNTAPPRISESSAISMSLSAQSMLTTSSDTIDNDSNTPESKKNLEVPKPTKSRRWRFSNMFSRKNPPSEIEIKLPDPPPPQPPKQPPKYKTTLHVYEDVYNSTFQNFLSRPVYFSNIYPNISFTFIVPSLSIKASAKAIEALNSLISYIVMYKQISYEGLEKIDKSKIPSDDRIEKYKNEFISMINGQKCDYNYIDTFYDKYSILYIKKLNIEILENLVVSIFKKHGLESDWLNFKNHILSLSSFVNEDIDNFFKNNSKIPQKELNIITMYINRVSIDSMPWYSIQIRFNKLYFILQLDHESSFDFICDNLLIGITVGSNDVNYLLTVENCLLQNESLLFGLKNIVQSGPHNTSSSFINRDSQSPTNQPTTTRTNSTISLNYGLDTPKSAVDSNASNRQYEPHETMSNAGIFLSFTSGFYSPHFQFEAFGSWVFTLNQSFINKFIELVNSILYAYDFTPYMSMYNFHPDVVQLLGLVSDELPSDMFQYRHAPSDLIKVVQDKIQKPSRLLAEDSLYLNTIRSSIVFLVILKDKSIYDTNLPILFIDLGTIGPVKSNDIPEQISDDAVRSISEIHGQSITLFKNLPSLFTDEDPVIVNLISIGNIVDVIRFNATKASPYNKIIAPTTTGARVYLSNSTTRPDAELKLKVISEDTLVFNLSLEVWELLYTFFSKLNIGPIEKCTSSRFSISYIYSSITLKFWNKIKSISKLNKKKRPNSSRHRTILTTVGSVGYIRLLKPTISQYSILSLNLSSEGFKICYNNSNTLHILCSFSLDYANELVINISELTLPIDQNFYGALSLFRFFKSSNSSTLNLESIPQTTILLNNATLLLFESTCILNLNFSLNMFTHQDPDNNIISKTNVFVNSITLGLSQEDYSLTSGWRFLLLMQYSLVTNKLHVNTSIEPIRLTLEPKLLSYLSIQRNNDKTLQDYFNQIYSKFNNIDIMLSVGISDFRVIFNIGNLSFMLNCEEINFKLDATSNVSSEVKDVQHRSLPNINMFQINPAFKSTRLATKSSRKRLARRLIPIKMHSDTQAKSYTKQHTSQLGQLSTSPRATTSIRASLNTLVYIDYLDGGSFLEPLSLRSLISGNRHSISLDVDTSWVNLIMRHYSENLASSPGHPPVLKNMLGIPVYISSESLTEVPNGSSIHLPHDIFSPNCKIKLVISICQHLFEYKLTHSEAQIKVLNFSLPSFDFVIPIRISVIDGTPIVVTISTTLTLFNNTSEIFVLYVSPPLSTLSHYLNNHHTDSSLLAKNTPFLLELPPNETQTMPLPWLFSRCFISTYSKLCGIFVPEEWSDDTSFDEINLLLNPENVDYNFYENNIMQSETIINSSLLSSIYLYQTGEINSCRLPSNLILFSDADRCFASEISQTRLPLLSYPLFNIYLDGCINVENLTPHRCRVVIGKIIETLDPGQGSRVYTYSNDIIFELEIGQGYKRVCYRSKHIAVGSFSLLNKKKYTIDTILQPARDDNLNTGYYNQTQLGCSLEISASTPSDEPIARRVTIFARHWIFNNQPLTIIVKSDHNLHRLKPGRCGIFNLSSYESMQLGLPDGRFSKAISLDVLTSPTQFYILPSRNHSARWFVVVAKPLEPPFQLSTLILIESRFTLVNKSPSSIYMFQRYKTSNGHIFRIPPNKTLAYHPLKIRHARQFTCFFTLIEPGSYVDPKTSDIAKEHVLSPYPIIKTAITQVCDVLSFTNLYAPFKTIIPSSIQSSKPLISPALLRHHVTKISMDYWRFIWTRRGRKLHQLDRVSPNSSRLMKLFHLHKYWLSRVKGGKKRRLSFSKLLHFSSRGLKVKTTYSTPVGGVQIIYKDLENMFRNKIFFRSKKLTVTDIQIKRRQKYLLSLLDDIGIVNRATDTFTKKPIHPTTASYCMFDINFSSEFELQLKQASTQLWHEQIQTARDKTARSTDTPLTSATRRLNLKYLLIDAHIKIDEKKVVLEFNSPEHSKYKIKNKTSCKIYFAEPHGHLSVIRPHSVVSHGWSSGSTQTKGQLYIMLSIQSRERPLTFICSLNKLRIHAIIPFLSHRTGPSSLSLFIAATLIQQGVRTLVFTTINAAKAINYVKSETVLSLRRGNVVLDRLYGYLQNRSRVIKKPLDLSLVYRLNAAGTNISLLNGSSNEEIFFFSSVPVHLTYSFSKTHNVRLLLGEISVDAFYIPLLRHCRFGDYWWNRWSGSAPTRPHLSEKLVKNPKKSFNVERQITESTWPDASVLYPKLSHDYMVRFYLSGSIDRHPVYLNHLMVATEPLDVIINTSVLRRLTSILSTSPTAACLSTALVYLEYFYVSPIRANLTLSTSTAPLHLASSHNVKFSTYVSSIIEDISDTPLSFNPIFQTNIFTNQKSLISDSLVVYQKQLVRQATKSIGSFNILGNPTSLLRKLRFSFIECYYRLLEIFSPRVYLIPFHLVWALTVFILATGSAMLDSASLCLFSLHCYAQQFTYYNANIAFDLLPFHFNRKGFFDPSGVLDSMKYGTSGSFFILVASILYPFILAGRRNTSATTARATGIGSDILKTLSFWTLGPPMSVILFSRSMLSGMSGTLRSIAKISHFGDRNFRIMRTSPEISTMANMQYDSHSCYTFFILQQSLSTDLHLHHLKLLSVYYSSKDDLFILTQTFFFHIYNGKNYFACEKDNIFKVVLQNDNILVFFKSKYKINLHYKPKKFFQKIVTSIMPFSDYKFKHIYKIHTKSKRDSMLIFETIASAARE